MKALHLAPIPLLFLLTACSAEETALDCADDPECAPEVVGPTLPPSNAVAGEVVWVTLPGHKLATAAAEYTDYTLEQCRAACEAEGNFDCYSVTYREDNNKCWLQESSPLFGTGDGRYLNAKTSDNRDLHMVVIDNNAAYDVVSVCESKGGVWDDRAKVCSPLNLNCYGSAFCLATAVKFSHTLTDAKYGPASQDDCSEAGRADEWDNAEQAVEDTEYFEDEGDDVWDDNPWYHDLIEESCQARQD